MKKFVIWGLVAIGVSAIAGYYLLPTSRTRTSPNVRRVHIQNRTITSTITGTGTVVPETRVDIKPPISGRIEKIAVVEGEVVHQGQIIAWMSSTDRAVLLDGARSIGPDEVKKWESMIRPAPIVAPISGTIISRGVEPGQTVVANDSLFVIADRLKIQVQIDETDVGKIRLGMPVNYELDAFPGRRLTGRVSKIGFESKVINNVTVYLIDIISRQSMRDMRAGMTAYVYFESAKVKNAQALPNEAIHSRRGKSTVTVQSSTGNYTHIDVITGITDGEFTEILTPLPHSLPIVIVEEMGPNPSRRRSQGSPLNPTMGRGRSGR